MAKSLIDLTGKFVLVTGGSRGIGRAICIRLAEHGARVCFNYLRNREAAAEAEKLMTVAAGGDKAAIAAQFGAMGKSGCGGCHKKFREKLN